MNLSIGGPDYLDLPFVEKVRHLLRNGHKIVLCLKEVILLSQLSGLPLLMCTVYFLVSELRRCACRRASAHFNLSNLGLGFLTGVGDHQQRHHHGQRNRE